MRCKDIPGPGSFARLVKVDAGFPHQLQNTFNGEERRVSLVHVADGGPNAERGKGTIPTDAEQNLLLDTHPFIAAVEIIGDVAQFSVLVLGDVGIQQI